MSLPLLNSDSNQGPTHMRHSVRSKGKYALAASVACMLLSTLLCGCAAGLMSMPGAAMLADRFGSDKEREADEEKKDKSE